MFLLNIIFSTLLLISFFLMPDLNENEFEENMEAVITSYANTLINNNELPTDFESMGISSNFFQKHEIKAYNWDENFKNLRKYQYTLFYMQQEKDLKPKPIKDYRIDFYNKFYITIDGKIYNAHILSQFANFDLNLIQKRQKIIRFRNIGVYHNHQVKVLSKIF